MTYISDTDTYIGLNINTFPLLEAINNERLLGNCTCTVHLQEA